MIFTHTLPQTGMACGDVVVVLHQKRHAVFQCLENNNDLVMTKALKLVDALCGFEFSITHLDGREVIIRAPDDVMKDGDIRTVVGGGMPFRHNPMQKGNLHIKFSIEMPSRAEITPEIKAALRSALSSTSSSSSGDPSDHVMPNADADEVVLQR